MNNAPIKKANAAKKQVSETAPTRRYTILLPEDLGEAAKQIPGGMSRLVRSLLTSYLPRYEQAYSEIMARELAQLDQAKDSTRRVGRPRKEEQE